MFALAISNDLLLGIALLLFIVCAIVWLILRIMGR
jgi:hypothetical protein